MGGPRRPVAVACHCLGLCPGFRRQWLRRLCALDCEGRRPALATLDVPAAMIEALFQALAEMINALVGALERKRRGERE